MNKFVYSIRDNKLGSFGVPVVIDNDAVAIRQFGDLISKKSDSIMSLHPEDFTIYCLAEYDAETGKFLNLDCPKALATGSDFSIKE